MWYFKRLPTKKNLTKKIIIKKRIRETYKKIAKAEEKNPALKFFINRVKKTSSLLKSNTS
jgi:hypothetical protein